MKTKSTLGVALAVAGLLVAVKPAMAVQYSDNDVLGVTIAAGGQVAGEFSIGSVNDGSGTFGYDSGSSVLSSATTSFSFSRANSLLGQVEILIGGLSFSSASHVVNSLVGTLSGSVLGLALSDLGSDGIVSYIIKNNSTAAIRVSSAALVAQSEIRSVPDTGGSIYLLGFGGIVLGLAYRRQGAVAK